MKTYPLLSRFFFLALLAGSLLNACTPIPTIPSPPPSLPDAALKRLPPAEFPYFTDGNGYRDLHQAIAMSLAYLGRLPPDRQIDFGNDAYAVAHLMRSLEYFDLIIRDRPSPDVLNQVIAEHFIVYRSMGRPAEKDVLYTGYYEPLLHGSSQPGPQFPIAVHSRPADLVEIDLGAFAADLKGRTIVGQYTGRSVIPYPTRNRIRQSADFDKTAPPVVWLRDEVDLFILQIQGSGRVELENGEQIIVLYAGNNGRPYRSIGRLLIDQGKIPANKMSMQAIRAYLQKNPATAQSILDHNARYIFFKKASEGPLGALGQLLTPMRSMAVDRRVMPSAALAFISLPLPVVDTSGRIQKWAPYSGFALAQDAGSAIVGPGRVDLFMGHGLKAETAASHLKNSGNLCFLVLNPQAMP